MKPTPDEADRKFLAESKNNLDWLIKRTFSSSFGAAGRRNTAEPPFLDDAACEELANRAGPEEMDR